LARLRGGLCLASSVRWLVGWLAGSAPSFWLGAALRWTLVCAAAAAAAVDKSIGNAAVPLCLCLLDSLFFFFFYLLFIYIFTNLIPPPQNPICFV